LCKVTAQYYKEGDKNVFGGAECGSSQWKLSPDKKSVAMPFASFMYLPNDKFGSYKVSFKEPQEELTLEFEFDNVAQPFKVGDGATYFGKDRSKGTPFMRHFYHPYGTCKGTVGSKGQQNAFTGVGVMVHATQVKPTRIAAHWNFVNFKAEDVGLVMLQLRAPKEYNGELVNHGSLTYKGDVYHVSADNEVAYLNTQKEDSTGYNVPKVIQYVWKGTHEDGRTIKAELKTQVGDFSNRIDMLGELPYLLRKVLQAVVAKPFAYQWFDECTVDLTLGSEKHQVKGRLFHEGCFELFFAFGT
jgi:hypothetical protein